MPTTKKRALSKKAGTYHHGDLRRALLDATLELIDITGPEAFTLRAAAKAAGVSDAAPYHHFADKEALLAAIATEGFQLLAERLQAAAAQQQHPTAVAQAMGVEYVVFAATHPSHFRVMVSRRVLRNTEHAELAASAVTAFTLVREALVAGAANVAARVREETLIFGAWALVHGFAFLAVDGHLGPLARDEDKLRSLVHSAIQLMDAPVQRTNA
ncbi:MAG: TetR/AcrR family transcriptional regulator [Polyangiaceae bacterium]|nr:TetR/AcrR family transcriptional regulator [Polyangiaceae bacterium]